MSHAIKPDPYNTPIKIVILFGILVAIVFLLAMNLKCASVPRSDPDLVPGTMARVDPSTTGCDRFPVGPQWSACMRVLLKDYQDIRNACTVFVPDDPSCKLEIIKEDRQEGDDEYIIQTVRLTRASLPTEFTRRKYDPTFGRIIKDALIIAVPALILGGWGGATVAKIVSLFFFML